MAHRLFGTFILLLVSGLFLSAQTGGGSSTPPSGSPVRIEEEVIVTATRSEAGLHTIGSSVTVISRAELERHHFQTIEEALATVPGLQMVRSGARGQVVSVLIRGAKSDQTLVMVDGIELNDPMNPSRGFDLGWLSLANVERIEVIRGPQSTIFGSDAIAGVIHIITRTGTEKPAVTVSAEGGSYNTWNFRGEVAGQHKNLRYSLAVAQAYSSGFSAADELFGNTEADGMRDISANGKFQYIFNPQLDATVTFHISDGRVDLDNWGGPYGDDPNYQQWQQRLSALAELRYAHPSGFWQQSAQFSYAGTDRDYRNDVDPDHPADRSEGNYNGIIRKVSWQNLFFPVKGHVVTAGYEFEEETGSSYYRSEGAWGPYEEQFPGRSASTHGVYFQDQLQYGEVFFLTGGVRLDHHSQFGNDWNFRVAPVLLVPSTRTRFHASAGTGFKAPTLYQLYAPPSGWGPIGNPGLQPEQSWAVDGGVEQYLLGQTVWIGATAFYNRYDDLIDFTNGYQNVGRARSAGLELTARWAPVRAFRTGWSYTLTEAMNLDTGEELLRRARHLFAGSWEYAPWDPLKLTGQVVVKGPRWDMNYSVFPYERVWMGTSGVVDLLVSYQLRRDLETYVKLQNILDSRAEEIYGYATPGFGAYGGIVWHIR
jgi:vitamin B12 transporter